MRKSSLYSLALVASALSAGQDLGMFSARAGVARLSVRVSEMIRIRLVTLNLRRSRLVLGARVRRSVLDQGR